jgi:hypothetical protein
MCVDLDGNVVPGACAQYLLDVNIVARAALKLSARNVAEDRRIWIRNGPQQQFGLRIVIELVEGAVGEDVALYSFQNPEVFSEALIEPIGLGCCSRMFSTDNPPA